MNILADKGKNTALKIGVKHH